MADGTPDNSRHLTRRRHDASTGTAQKGHRVPRYKALHRGFRDGRADLGLVLAGVGALAAMALLRRQPMHKRQGSRHRPVRRVRDGAAILGASVLADSALEHFRGGFRNPAMYAAPLMGAVAVGSSRAAIADGLARRVKTAGHGANIVFGATGLGFHLFNILKRPGGISWNNLFYAAPLGAPGALVVAGALNIGADRLQCVLDEIRTPRPQRRVAGRLLAGFTSIAIAAESAEVALLHFRGAWHNPAMFAPVTIPPATAALLLDRALRPAGGDAAARGVLWLTGALGVIGTGFHVYGVGRNMGGWRNWRQNVQAGPPIPAPISFLGLALAGFAALDLLRQDRAIEGAQP